MLQAAENDCLWRVNGLSFPPTTKLNGNSLHFSAQHGDQSWNSAQGFSRESETVLSKMSAQRAHMISVIAALYSFVVLTNSTCTMTIKLDFTTKTQQMMLSAGSVVQSTNQQALKSSTAVRDLISKIACCSSAVGAACSLRPHTVE